MKAIGNNIIVAPTEEEVLRSGLIVTGMERPMHGIALNIGPKVKEVQPFSKIYFTDIVYTTEVDGKRVYIVSEDKVFAMVANPVVETLSSSEFDKALQS